MFRKLFQAIIVVVLMITYLGGAVESYPFFKRHVSSVNKSKPYTNGDRVFAIANCAAWPITVPMVYCMFDLDKGWMSEPASW